MAVVLYRKGSESNIRGIQCEKCVVNTDIDSLLKQGWKLRPEDTLEPPEEPKEDDASEDKGEGEQEENEMAIREKAKEAGIDHWWNKKIETLEKELSELEDGESDESRSD